jgi:hypothetical protein
MTTARTLYLTSIAEPVSVFDGNLEQDIEVPGAIVAISDGETTWTGTATSPDSALGLDEWVSGSIRELVTRHGRAITDALSEAAYSAAMRMNYVCEIEID